MSLTHVANQTRMIVVSLIATIVMVVLGTMGWNFFSQLLRDLNPPPPPAPTYGFGALPPIVFPENNAANYTYRLETVGNQLPSIIAPFMPVYRITNIKPPSGFFLSDRARQQASALGFILEPTQLGDTRYRWNRSTPISATLTMDVPNNWFEMTVAWETDPGFLSHTTRPTPEQATTEIKSLLKGAGFLPDDLDNGQVRTKLLEYRSGQLAEAVSLSETQFVQVDLFRAPILFNNNVYPILGSDPNTGLARGLVSSVRTQGKRIVSLSYTHETIDYTTPQTYPFISGPEAWQLLNAGQGYVAVSPKSGSTQAVIRRVAVAYFDPLDDTQQYLQPIYVFYGDEDFVAYVPALHPQVFTSFNSN